jgi:hypothetical protein
VSDTAAHCGGQGRPGMFVLRAFRPLAFRPFPLSTFLTPAPYADSFPVRRGDGGREATSAKVLALGPLYLLLAAVPGIETPVYNDDDGNDDDARPSALASSIGAWTFEGGCAPGLLPFRLVPPFLLSRRRRSLLPRRLTTRRSNARCLSPVATVLARFLQRWQHPWLGGSHPCALSHTTTAPTYGGTEPEVLERISRPWTSEFFRTFPCCHFITPRPTGTAETT